MVWNYRIIKHVDSNNKITFDIREVYYKEQDKIVFSVSEEPAIPSGETALELEDDIRLMLEAFEKPILNYSEI